MAVGPPGVYADATTKPSWNQRALAACLAAGENAVLSHRSAARVAELDGFGHGSIEIASPRNIRWPGVRAHRTRLQPWERTTVNGFPSTVPARTLIDLATLENEARVEHALDSAIRKGLVSVDYLTRWLGRYPRCPPGASLVAQLLNHRGREDRHTESDLEVRFLRLLRAARPPLPVAQYEVHGPNGFVARVDFAYPDRRIAIECDGYAWTPEDNSGNATFDEIENLPWPGGP